MNSRARVGIVGLWHLGTVTAAGLAHLGFPVTGLEPDDGRRARLAQGKPPMYEPGLAELLREGIESGRLAFTADPREAFGEAEFVLFAEDVTVTEHDEPDVSRLVETARRIGPYLRSGAAVVVQSQVPVGTCARLLDEVRVAAQHPDVHLAYCPENLRLGSAIDRFLRPDMIVIGADTPASRARVEALFEGLDAPRIVMSVRSAEMAKHALNFLLATAVSFGNEVARLCELAGAEAEHVTDALRHDQRIGHGLPISPGPPFTGGTLARDVSVLRALAARHGVRAPLLDGVVAVNDAQKGLALSRLERAFISLRGLQVAVLGLTYKAGTSTVRRSLALELINALGARGAAVTAYDPLADLSDAGILPAFQRAADPYAAALGADAVVIMTDWPEFRTLDLDRLRGLMRGTLLVDTRNAVNAARAGAAGFSYHGVGRHAEPQ